MKLIMWMENFMASGFIPEMDSWMILENLALLRVTWFLVSSKQNAALNL